MITKLVKKSARAFGFDFVPRTSGLSDKLRSGRVKPLSLETVLSAYLAAAADTFFVQIGANNGQIGDPIYEIVTRHNLRGLLVEPQSSIFYELRQNYAHQPQLLFEHCAVSNTDGEITLYKVAKDFWYTHNLPGDVDTQIASLNREQIRKHVEMFGGGQLAENEESYLVEETVPAFTFASLLEKHRIERVDILQIDTEGFDFEVLKMIDWNRIRPKVLHFEDIHLSETDRSSAYALLEDQGYQLYAPDLNNTLCLATGSGRI